MIRQKHVLVVDDDRELGVALATLLQGCGYATNCVLDGKSALEEMAANGYGLVILDVKLPDMSAVDVMKAVQKLRRKPKVIALTGYASVESAVELTQLGALRYIKKPFSPDDIVRHVQEAIGHPSEEDEDEKIGRLIRSRFRLARIAQGLTIKTLAQKTDLSSSLLSQIETGKISPSLSSLIRIAKSLNLPLKNLFDEEETNSQTWSQANKAA